MNSQYSNIVGSVSVQKFFGCFGSQFKAVLPVLSGIKVNAKRGLRCKPKKNTGLDHSLQFFSAKLCGHKSVYKMQQVKTPKTLKRKGIEFLAKSTHYDNVSSVDVESVWLANAELVKAILPEQVTVMLDFTPDPLEGGYEAKRKGYVGRKKGKPVTDYCHQIASAFFVRLKIVAYSLRLPGNYVAFSNPKEHSDRKLSSLNFEDTIAKQIVKKVHALYPNKRFQWLFDRGFDDHGFWAWLKELGDDFVTSLDKNAECVKTEQRQIDSESIVLKKADKFEYHETLVEVANMKLKAVYIKPIDDTPPYWLLTNKHELTGLETKKVYNARSGEEPMFDYLKNDYNLKKPCNKNFAGAQAYTALLCLAHNMVSLLSKKIFGAYLQLQTLNAFLTEHITLCFLFEEVEQKKTLAKQPPTKTASHRHQKK